MEHYSPEERQTVYEAFKGTLDKLDRADREPDRWEEDALLHALGAMACDMYRLAAVEIDMARAALGERSRESMRRLNASPRKFTNMEFRRGLTSIRAFHP